MLGLLQVKDYMASLSERVKGKLNRAAAEAAKHDEKKVLPIEEIVENLLVNAHTLGYCEIRKIAATVATSTGLAKKEPVVTLQELSDDGVRVYLDLIHLYNRFGSLDRLRLFSEDKQWP